MLNSRLKSIVAGKSRGSLIPLSFGFFIISLSLLFISINLNAAYATKKELINLGESAVQRSAHEIDALAYYLELNRFNQNKRIPIDCQAAKSVFYNIVLKMDLSGHQIDVEEFNCSLFEISAKISVVGKMPLNIPLLGLANENQLQITAMVGANSPYQLS